MHTLTFTNRGVIDPRMIAIMGVSVKTGTNPIGYFGTGLKYAIAIFLRLGCEVEMETGGKTFKLRKKKVTIRGEDFELVCMGRRELGFTTKMGRDWKLWQAFRELYSNCLDEGGRLELTKDGDKLPWVGSKSTCFRVKGPQMMGLFNEAEDIIMTRTPFMRLPGVDMHSGISEHFFRRGIRAGEVPYGESSLFTYNFTDNLSLTEDRTLRFPHQAEQALIDAISICDDGNIIKSVLEAEEGYFEHRLDFMDNTNSNRVSRAFVEAVEELTGKGVEFNSSSREVVKRVGKGVGPMAVGELSEEEAATVVRATELAGLLVDEHAPVVVADQLAGRMSKEHHGTIYIAHSALVKGVRYVAGLVFLERLAKKKGVKPTDPIVREHLLDMIVAGVE